MAAKYIDIHTHRRSSDPDTLSVVSYGLGRDRIPSDPGGPFSAGIHPWSAAGVGEDILSAYLDYLRRAPIAAVGEAGLDYYRGGDRDSQQKVFRAQIDIATARSLPVISHCVKAYNDLLSILKDYPGVVFILHGYTGSPQQTEGLLETGCFFSMGERSLGSPKTVDSIKLIPTDRIFAETDESPIPIAEVYNKLAVLKGVGTTGLAGVIENNFEKIFRL